MSPVVVRVDAGEAVHSTEVAAELIVSPCRDVPFARPLSVLLDDAYRMSPVVVVGIVLAGDGLADHAGALPTPVAVNTNPAVEAPSRAIVLAEEA